MSILPPRAPRAPSPDVLLLVTALGTAVVVAIAIVAATRSAAAVVGALVIALAAAAFVNIRVAALLDDGEPAPPASEDQR